MFKWFKDFLKGKQEKGLIEQVEALSHTNPEVYPEGISEPVITFVKYVKSNPRNFSIFMDYSSEVEFRYELQYQFEKDIHKSYTVIDKKLGDKWSVGTKERPFRMRMVRFDDYNWYHREFEEQIFSVSNLNFELTLSERYYLMDELKPLFQRQQAKDRRERIAKSRQGRLAKIEADRQQAERTIMFNKYKELV